MIDRTLQPGEVTEISEEQAATLLALEPTGFFVGYDEPDWDYYHAPRLLCGLATSFGTDKGPNGHNYTPLYTRHFGPLRQQPVNLLEIGVWRGGSLRMWEQWFPNGTIIGVDIAPETEVNTDRVTTVVSDIKDYTPDRPFDIVIDDGSHIPDDITAAVTALLPQVRSGGWYVIEDLAVVPVGSSTFSWLRPLVEDLATEHSDTLSEVHIYPQIVFLRKAETHPQEGET